MTASEKAVFDRIFKDIEQGSLGAKEEEEYDGGEIGEAQETDSNPFEDLNSIFEEATQRLKQEEEAREQRAEGSKKPRTITKPSDRQAIGKLIHGEDISHAESVMRSIKLDNGVSLGVDTGMQGNQEELEKACEDHRTLVSMMLDRTRSDVEIWEILEKEVFDLVRQLNAHTKTEEKARKVLKREEKKLAKEKNTGKEGVASQDTDADDQTTPKMPSSKTSQSIALPTTTLFSILQSNYADCLLSALRLLRRYHPTSLYAHSILSTMKRLGPISYALGANTNIYNEILFLKWMQFSDLHGMADLMQEMIDQGIEMNEVTKVFIRRLWSKKRYGRMGRMGPVVQAWWEMRGNVEGWRRVWGIYEDVKKEDREKREREALIAGNEYDGAGGVGEDG